MDRTTPAGLQPLGTRGGVCASAFRTAPSVACRNWLSSRCLRQWLMSRAELLVLRAGDDHRGQKVGADRALGAERVTVAALVAQGAVGPLELGHPGHRRCTYRGSMECGQN